MSEIITMITRLILLLTVCDLDNFKYYPALRNDVINSKMQKQIETE